jgi:hypothetical protein
MKPEEWSQLSSDKLYAKFEMVKYNNASLTPSRERPAVVAEKDTAEANYVNSRPKGKSMSTPKPPMESKNDGKICFEYARSGQCGKQGCTFLHTKKEENASRSEKQKQKAVEEKHDVCDKCTQKHTWKTVCAYCKKRNHCESVCRNKEKPKIALAAVEDQDGDDIIANLFTVNLNSAHNDSHSLKDEEVVDGKVLERFYADTGANRSLHPSMRSAASYYRTAIDINTASGKKSMKTEGVGQMKLYTPDGESMPGFGNVLFTKQATEKLASVGELCDAGLVCVFDKYGMSTYKEQDLCIKGPKFTHDQRDPKNKLYPFRLYRKKGERENVFDDSLISLVDTQEEKAKTKYACVSVVEKLPSVIECPNGVLPEALLARVYVKPGLSDLERYHAKFGDIGVKYIKRCLPEISIPRQYRCEYCIDGKIHRFEHRTKPFSARIELAPGTVIHTDHSGPYAKSLAGARYSQLYIDIGSGYLWAKRQASKICHYEDTPKILIDARGLSGRDPLILKSDGDGVFSGKETEAMCEKFKLRHEFSAPYDSDTNASVERARRTIFEGVATSLLRSGAPACFWGEAEAHKVFTINNLPTVPDPTNPGKFCSRRNLLEGNRKPYDLERLMPFGTAATAYVPVESRRGGKHPAQRKSFQAIILGYEDNMPAYRLWDIEAKKVRLNSFAFTICHEGFYPFRERNNWSEEWEKGPQNFSPVADGVLTLAEWKKYEFSDEEVGNVMAQAPQLLVHAPADVSPEEKKEKKSSESDVTREIQKKSSESKSFASEQKFEILPASLAEKPPLPAKEIISNVPPIPKYDSVGTKNFWKTVMPKIDLAESGQVPEIANGALEKPVSIPPPKSFKEAMVSPWRKNYFDAAKMEFDGHCQAKTWILVPRTEIPKGKNILRGKWVFDDKRDERGKISKFKARFVAMGFTQKFGEDYTDTFAGVMIGKSFRILLSILNASPDHEMEHWDVRMAFTQAEVREDLYLEQPEGFQKQPEKFVCKLLKSLYGLKQSAHNWQQLLIEIMLSAKFIAAKSDSCVFIRRENDRWCFCCTHVDDIFILFNPGGQDFRNELFEKFQGRVQLENLGPVSWALKTNILRDRESGVLKISQESYISEVLDKHLDKGMLGEKKGGEHPYFLKSKQEEKKEIVDEHVKKQFQSQIGALWWLAQISRPDIYYPLHLCAKAISEPTMELGKRLQRIFLYLKATQNYGLVFTRPTQDTPTFSAFVDAAFASEDETQSRSAYLYFYNGNLVAWSSSSIKRAMGSSTEAECKALAELCRENVWQRLMQQELGVQEARPPECLVFEDNQSTISLLKKGQLAHRKSKYYGLDWAYVRDANQSKEIVVEYVESSKQRADFMTKAINITKFQEHRDFCMGDNSLQDYFLQ